MAVKVRVWVVTERGRPVDWGWNDGYDLAVMRQGKVSLKEAERAQKDIFNGDERKLKIRAGYLIVGEE